MSHTVIRGEPTAAQFYLDTVLDKARGSLKHSSDITKTRDEVNLAELIYYSLEEQPKGVYMINGENGEKVLNREILHQTVRLARTLQYKYEPGTIVMLVMRNHQHMAIAYYASLFANVMPLMIDPHSTLYELRHFLTLASPSIVFCDNNRYDDVIAALKYTNRETDTTVVIADKRKGFEELCAGYNEDLNNFRQVKTKMHDYLTLNGDETIKISPVTPETHALLIPTSGSSGFPKATILSHAGLIAQLPIIWTHYDNFPRPTETALLLSTAQWMTHTILMTSCPVYGVSLLMTPQKPTIEHVLELVEQFRPSWALVGPMFAKSLAASAAPGQLRSLESVVTAGSPLTSQIVATLKEKIPNASLLNGMGMTEMHGFTTMPGPNMPWSSNGEISNTILYKIISEDGKDLGVHGKGELYLKSDICIFKGYYRNNEAYREAVSADGWFQTGDIFCIDDKELYFIERKKFWFKYLNYHIAPEEVETVISSVQGVQDCVVTDSEKGPAAVVVLRADNVYNESEIRNQIHDSVNSTLSDYKRLRGGVAFVSSLPYTHSGKIKRSECKILINSLQEGELCF